MILEAFQSTIVRNADSLLWAILFWASLMVLLSVAAIISASRRQHGHQPSSAGGAPTTGIPSGGSSGSRPEPPRSGSGVQPPVDHLARIARLRAELADLTFAAPMAGPQMRQAANRLDELSAEKGDRALADHIRTLSLAHEDALKNARDTLEATKP